MARKIQYRAVSFEQVRPDALANALSGARKLVVAIDVAKTKMMAGFAREDGAVVRLVKWTSPLETRVFIELVMQTARLLDVQEVEALMEPTGTYGDPLGALLLAHGAQVFMLSPKRVHDAAEVFDGVPSMHDAKACVVIARLHHQGVSKPYIEPSPLRVQMRALVEQRELYRVPMQFYLSRLESLLARHWPEALQDVDVWRSKTPLALLARYPGPNDMHEHADDVLQNVHRLGHAHLRAPQAQRMLDCAQRSVGVALEDEAKRLIQLTATEALHMRNALDDIDDRIEQLSQEHAATSNIATTVGKVTAVLLVAHLGPLTDYTSAAALEKACGLNLKMRSSGNYLGRLSITKRGSPVVRHYLYLAALRLIRNDPRVAAWFRERGGFRGGHKRVAIVAVMRKLIRALWHVARGTPFDSSKLIDERALPGNAAATMPMTSHDAVALHELSAAH